MLVKTKYFGEIDLADDKVIEFKDGLIGFEDLHKYTVLYDNSSEKRSEISWLQSIEEPAICFPIISPLVVYAGYNPIVEDEVLAPIGNIEPESLLLFVTLSVPADITKMTCNLKAPIIVNINTKRGCQVIAENSEYAIKYNIYELVQKMKQEKGE